MSFVTLLWIVFLMAALLYVGYGIVLAYHWVRWSGSVATSTDITVGMSAEVATSTLAILLYGSAGAFLFSVMLGALLTVAL